MKLEKALKKLEANPSISTDSQPPTELENS